MKNIGFLSLEFHRIRKISQNDDFKVSNSLLYSLCCRKRLLLTEHRKDGVSNERYPINTLCFLERLNTTQNLKNYCSGVLSLLTA